MARATKLTEAVEPSARVLPVESSDGFRADDWIRMDAERMRVARVPNDHLLVVVDRYPKTAHASSKGSVVEREE